jgi:hypothetical protein
MQPLVLNEDAAQKNVIDRRVGRPTRRLILRGLLPRDGLEITG